MIKKKIFLFLNGGPSKETSKEKTVWYHKSPVEEVSLKGGKCWMYQYKVHRSKVRMGVDHWIWQDESHWVPQVVGGGASATSRTHQPGRAWWWHSFQEWVPWFGCLKSLWQIFNRFKYWRIWISSTTLQWAQGVTTLPEPLQDLLDVTKKMKQFSITCPDCYLASSKASTVCSQNPVRRTEILRMFSQKVQFSLRSHCHKYGRPPHVGTVSTI